MDVDEPWAEVVNCYIISYRHLVL